MIIGTIVNYIEMVSRRGIKNKERESYNETTIKVVRGKELKSMSDAKINLFGDLL